MYTQAAPKPGNPGFQSPNFLDLGEILLNMAVEWITGV
jgi:hypothetical protein